MVKNTIVVPASKRPSKGHARPFVKWAGGKRNALPALLNHLPSKFSVYFEPFVGGGALFYSIADSVKKAHLSDFNDELMTAYRVVKTNCEQLIQELKKHQMMHGKRHYAMVRNQNSLECSVQRAARLIYLNKTCFNGLYRVNKAGRFNVPMGRYKNPRIVDADNLRAVSKTLKQAVIKQQSFERIRPKSDAFVYCDPPYHETYDSYTEERFSEDKQRQLADCAAHWHRKGVNVMISNADTGMIRELYKARYWRKISIDTTQCISCIGVQRRQKIAELIITNYALR